MKCGLCQKSDWPIKARACPGFIPVCAACASALMGGPDTPPDEADDEDDDGPCSPNNEPPIV